MTEYRQDKDVREEERERIRAICMERFEYYFDPFNDQLELLNTLEREFPDIDPEWLEDYMIDAYSDRDYETRDSYSVMEWSGGEGFSGPVGEVVAIKEVEKDYLLIAYTEGSPGYSEMARYRKREFDALSKEDQSVLLLSFIRALSRDGDVFEEGTFTIDFKRILKKEADVLFKAMGVKGDSIGFYELERNINIEGELEDAISAINARAAEVKIANVEEK